MRKNLNMSASVALFLLIFPLASLSASDCGPDDILGVWLIERDGQVLQQIEIQQCEDAYCGTIIWLAEPTQDGQPRLDERNRNHSLRNRQLLGLQVITGYTHRQGNVWSGGELYAFEKGRTVSPELRLIDKDHLEVRVRILMFNKTLVWRRLPLKE